MRNPDIGHAKFSEVIGFIIIMAAGFVFLSFGLFSISQAMTEQQSYTETTGTVTNTSITTVGGDAVGNTGFLDDEDYMVTIEYQYEVDGQVYESSKVFADDERPNIVDNQGRAEKLIEKYGMEPTVHYNPTNPADSYLSANPFGIVSVLLTVLGVLTIVQGAYQLYDAATTPDSET